MLILLLAIATPQCSVAANDDTCKLTQNEPAKPDPSLMQCYKYNTLACCVSGHDSTILEVYQSTLSSSCLREYPLLEYFFCFGCHPDQPEYTYSEGSSPEIRVCESFANSLFEMDLERCGISIGIENPLVTLENPAHVWEVGHHQASDTQQVIIPNKVFANATAFLNAIKPPYFENYDIVIVPASEGETACFSSTSRFVASTFVPMLTFLFTRLFASNHA